MREWISLDTYVYPFAIGEFLFSPLFSFLFFGFAEITGMVRFKELMCLFMVWSFYFELCGKYLSVFGCDFVFIMYIFASQISVAARPSSRIRDVR